jgi:hypothetical protein
LHNGEISWPYIFSEANQVADALAKHEFEIYLPFHCCDAILLFCFYPGWLTLLRSASLEVFCFIFSCALMPFLFNQKK